MKEDTLNKLRAEGMTRVQLTSEILRIKGAMASPQTSDKQRRRYQRRLDIFTAREREFAAASPQPQRFEPRPGSNYAGD